MRDLDAAETMTLSPVPIGREIAVKCFLVLLTFRRSPKLRGSPTRDRGSVEAGDARRAWAGRDICALGATIAPRRVFRSHDWRERPRRLRSALVGVFSILGEDHYGVDCRSDKLFLVSVLVAARSDL